RAENALARKRPSLQTIRIDGRQGLILERSTEILKKPPRNAVRTADDDGGWTEQRRQLRCQFGQTLRFDGEKDVILKPKFRGRSRRRMRLPYLAGALNPKTGLAQSCFCFSSGDQR